MDKFLFWTPRILTIAFILFISSFALDSFSSEKSVAENIGAFLIHLVPSVVLFLFLLLAWKFELLGTIAFAVLGITYIIISWGKFPLLTYLLISGPLFLISVFYLMGWLNKRNADKRAL